MYMNVTGTGILSKRDARAVISTKIVKMNIMTGQDTVCSVHTK